MFAMGHTEEDSFVPQGRAAPETSFGASPVLVDSRAKARTFYALFFAFYFEFESCEVIETGRKEDVEGSPAACPL
ncbi:hypothetical protein [Alicyclobacillus ferrooxydans]|uniref:Uncharacterized protein n=1 Tax=Alicyclobacillus ferrooxydans TaxID=471514 RepID=A0A0P9CXN1_9BACL|nr:hypothetical protein [Alicyclobacillus ferrooxydans]KPV44522.1 hypothetical protein AN477_05790 [Alicyclobacillus ferrooxydans]